VDVHQAHQVVHDLRRWRHPQPQPHGDGHGGKR
jgi:hypothetical protein